MTHEADLLLEQAAEALKNKQYPAAEELQRRGCQLLREQGAEEIRIANEIERLADIHCAQRKFDLCANEYADVVRMREKFLPENDFSILRVLYRSAKSHFESQQYELSESEMRRVLSIGETHTDAHETLAFCLYELGFLLYYVGKYREAEPFLLRALPICDANLGARHHQTIQVLGGLALLYKNCTDLGKDPEPYFRRAIEVSKPEKELEGTYLMNLCRLADYVAERKRYEEADELYSQLVTVVDASRRRDDSDLHWIVSSCVKYFESRGKGELVAHLVSEKQNSGVYADMVRKRLEHAEQTLSEDDPELVEALLAAGNNATFEGRYTEAEPLLLRALDASRKIHGEKSPQTLFALTRVCIVSRLLRKFEQAESAIQKALTIAGECFPDDRLRPWTLENFALLREAESKIGEAAEAYKGAVAEYERICGFPSCQTAEALYHQSGFLLRVGDFGAAEKAVKRAISVLDEVEGLSDSEKSDYFGTLASIMKATGRNSEAAEMQNRADELFQAGKKGDESEE
jgi:tetratricopeptide (TPR) repeat protein